MAVTMGQGGWGRRWGVAGHLLPSEQCHHHTHRHSQTQHTHPPRHAHAGRWLGETCSQGNGTGRPVARCRRQVTARSARRHPQAQCGTHQTMQCGGGGWWCRQARGVGWRGKGMEEQHGEGTRTNMYEGWGRVGWGGHLSSWSTQNHGNKTATRHSNGHKCQSI